MKNFQYIERKLFKLLMQLEEVLSNLEKNEVSEFINVGEYGLALETLVDIIKEENKNIHSNDQQLILELASIMLLDEEIFRKKLFGNIIE